MEKMLAAMTSGRLLLNKPDIVYGSDSFKFSCFYSGELSD